MGEGGGCINKKGGGGGRGLGGRTGEERSCVFIEWWSSNVYRLSLN